MDRRVPSIHFPPLVGIFEHAAARDHRPIVAEFPPQILHGIGRQLGVIGKLRSIGGVVGVVAEFGNHQRLGAPDFVICEEVPEGVAPVDLQRPEIEVGHRGIVGLHLTQFIRDGHRNQFVRGFRFHRSGNLVHGGPEVRVGSVAVLPVHFVPDQKTHHRRMVF